jgi:uncharacterized protein YjbI with pentapeptide repeats
MLGLRRLWDPSRRSISRRKALKLLTGGKAGIAEWNRRRKAGEPIPDLQYADLSAADLRGANFGLANLRGAKLSRTILNEANLLYARLSAADLIAASLREADLRSADLREAVLTGAVLSRADLTDADLSGGVLRGVDLGEAKVLRVRLNLANLSEVKLSGLDVSASELNGVNLGKAELVGIRLIDADLSRANLVWANLRDVDLTRARLSEASLSQASLTEVDLSQADLTSANLEGTKLSQVNFAGAILEGADLSRAVCRDVNFGNVDLSTVKRLESTMHLEPSTMGIDTLFRSQGKIPQAFLRGCGVPSALIEYLPGLLGSMTPIEFYSCFISYSHEDEEFAKRLHSRLVQERLRVWYAPEDIQAGKKLLEQIDEAIRVHEKLLLLVSEKSMRSKWVRDEIRRARKAEVQEAKRKLFPIRLVSFQEVERWQSFYADLGEDLAEEIREYFIPDFSNWKDHDSFETEFARLLNDLKAEESTGAKPA